MSKVYWKLPCLVFYLGLCKNGFYSLLIEFALLGAAVAGRHGQRRRLRRSRPHPRSRLRLPFLSLLTWRRSGRAQACLPPHDACDRGGGASGVHGGGSNGPGTGLPQQMAAGAGAPRPGCPPAPALPPCRALGLVTLTCLLSWGACRFSVLYLHLLSPTRRCCFSVRCTADPAFAEVPSFLWRTESKPVESNCAHPCKARSASP